jgi:hypothetical protein
MKSVFGAALAAFVLTAADAAPPTLQLAPKSQPAKPAGPVDPDAIFAQGAIEQARSAYAAVPKSSPRYEEAQRQLGEIALAQNHLGEAEALLAKARALNPADERATALLAGIMQRADRFAETAQLLRQIHRPDRAAEFELFGKSQPYRAPDRSATIELQWTEPFPVVQASVNGLQGLFLIDTGAPEIVLDPEFAHAAHVAMTVPPARKGPRMPAIVFGRIEKFTLPGFETDEVPAMLVGTRGLSASARQKRLAGVIGTQFLSHFRATLDYVHSRLILEPRDAAPRKGGTIAEIPFWIVGDHILLASGRLADGPKQLFFINTGMSGYAFVGPESTLKDAGISVPALQGPMSGRMGLPRTATFPIPRLSLGELTESNLTGLYGTFPPALENGLGLHIAGVVSHAFFNKYVVTYDFVQMKIDIRK